MLLSKVWVLTISLLVPQEELEFHETQSVPTAKSADNIQFHGI